MRFSAHCVTTLTDTTVTDTLYYKLQMLRLELQPTRVLVPADPLVDLLVLDEVRLLPERFRAHVAPERFLPRVCSQMYFYVGLVQKPSIAYPAPVYRLLLPQQPAQLRRGSRRERE